MQFLYKKNLLFLIIVLSTSVSLWAQKDCVSATAICGTATVPPPTAGIGSITDLVSNPCSSTDNESATAWNNSTWTTFTITTAGTLQMNFDANPDADIDFALWRIPGSGGVPVSLSTACASINNTGSPLASTRCDFDADATGSGFGAVCGGGTGCDPAGELTVAVGDRIVAIVSDYSSFNNFAFQAAFGGTSQHDCQPDCNSCANATCQNSAPNIYSNLTAANAGTDGCNPEQVRSNQNGANATFCTTFTTPSGLSGQYISMAGSLTSTVLSGSPCAAFVSESLQDAACGSNITPTFTVGGYPAWQVAPSTTYKYCWVWGGGGDPSCDQYSSPCFRPFYNCPTITVSGATTVCGTTTYTQTGAVSPLGTWSVSPIAAGTITSGGVFTPTIGFTGAATITYTEPSPSVCAGSLAITVATGPTTTGATICPGGSGTLTASACSNTTGSTTGSVTLNGTSSTNIPVSGSFTPTVPAGATVTSISYTSSTASTTDWRSELRFEIIHTNTMSIQPDNVNNSSGSVTAPAASSNTFNTLAAAGIWTVQWRDVTSPYNVTVSNQTITVTINYTYTPTLEWYTAASGGTPVQTGTPFNPVGDAEVIAAGAPYSSLTNSNTPDTYTFYAACSSVPNCRTATNFVINTPPTANAGSDVTLTCTTPSATIGTAAVGGNTYAWSPATGLSATNIAQPTANGTSTQTYTVTVTGSNGCTATDAVVVTADKTAPTANAGSDVTLTCTTPSATIGTAAVGGNTYAWSPATGLSATNVAQPTANGTSTQTYTVTVTGSNGCTATDAVVVTADKTAPTTTITGTTTYCLNDAATPLSASGTGTFAWTGSGVNGPASGSGSTLTPQTTNAGNTDYTVTLTAANGCQDTDMATVTVNNCACPTPPSVVITPATAATCGTNVVTLNYTVANGPAALSHDGTGTLSTTSLANGTGTFTYTPSAGDAGNTVTVTATIADPDGAGVCVASTDNVVITVNALPAATAASNSPVACGGTINLTSSGGNAYSWAGPGGFTSSTQNPTRTGANASMAGTYTVTVTSSNGCTASASTVVSVSGCSFVFGILDPCACRNNATTLTNGQFNETVIVTGPAGFVVRAEVVTGLYQPASTAVTLVPFTVPVNMPYNGTNGYELQGVHVDNTGYTVTAGIYQADGVTPVDIDAGTPGVQNTLTISNKCAYPNPDFALPSTVCNTGAAIALTATNGAGPAGIGTFSGPGVSSSTFYPASAGVGGPYNITLQYTGGADANSGVSPDGGTTPAYPGCVQDVAKSISVTDCCGASVGTFPGN